MAHGIACFARLVRVILGPGAVAEEKVDSGVSLVILGIDITIAEGGISYRPDAAKAKKWRSEIQKARVAQKLLPGPASKLAGRLSWGSTKMFNKFGRALLRPIFDQKTKRDGCTNPELDAALDWWDEILALEIAETRTWVKTGGRPAHLFCDARGAPPHLGAVLFVDGAILWTHCKPEEHLMHHFRSREDNQIMGLELLGAALGFSTFQQVLTGRKVVLHCDNKGAEVRPLSRCAYVSCAACVSSLGVHSERRNEVLGPRAACDCTLDASCSSQNGGLCKVGTYG